MAMGTRFRYYQKKANFRKNLLVETKTSSVQRATVRSFCFLGTGAIPQEFITRLARELANKRKGPWSKGKS